MNSSRSLTTQKQFSKTSPLLASPRGVLSMLSRVQLRDGMWRMWKQRSLWSRKNGVKTSREPAGSSRRSAVMSSANSPEFARNPPQPGYDCAGSIGERATAAGAIRQWRRVAKQSLPRRSACLLRLSYVEAEALVDARVRQGEGAPRHICVFKTTGRLSRSMRRSPSAAPSGKQGTAAATGTTPPEACQRHPESLPDPC